MKVNEILTENNSQLNEAIPLIAGIGVGALLTAVSAALAGYSAFELYKLVKKYNEDPDAVTDDQYGDMFFDIALLAVPAVGRLGKAGIVKLVPNSMKRRLGKWLRKRVVTKVRNQRVAKTTKAAKSTSSKAMSKARAANAKALVKSMTISKQAKAGALSKIKAFPVSLSSALSIGVATQFAQVYWGKMIELETQYTKYKNGDMTTEIFLDDPDKARAHKKYLELREIILGELVVGITFAVGGISASKAAGFLGKIFGTATGSGFVGGLIAMPFNIAAKLLKFAGPGMTLFMQTETGKQFLENALVQFITSGVGKLTSEALQLLGSAVEELSKKAGVPAVGKAVGDKLKPAAAPAGLVNPSDEFTKGNVDHAPQLRVFVNPRDPKDIKINNVRVTNDAGYLDPLLGPTVKDIRDTARIYKLPDPTQRIPRDPNATYNF